MRRRRKTDDNVYAETIILLAGNVEALANTIELLLEGRPTGVSRTNLLEQLASVRRTSHRISEILRPIAEPRNQPPPG